MKRGPFSSNGEFLVAAFRWLAAKIKLVSAERDLRQGGYVHKHPDDCIVAVRSREADLRQQLDERLSAHRESGQFKLGIDALWKAHGLDPDPEEESIILALVAHAISDAAGDEVLAGLGTGSSWLTAGDLGQLLGPGDIAGWLRVRPLFTPSGRLRASGIVEVRSSSCDGGARGSLDGYFFISRRAFAIVVGQEVEADESEVG